MKRSIVFVLILFVVLSLFAFDETFPFGMNNTVYQTFSDTTGKYDEYRKRYKKTMDSTAYGLCIGWWRAQNKFRWGDIQPNCTTWIWDNEDSLVKWAGERGMHIIPVFGYTAPWAHHSELPDSKKDYWQLYPPDPSYWNNYKEYVKQLVERYDGDGESDFEGLIIPIKYWEFMNEPYSKKPFLGTPKQYVEMFDSTIVALKEADPEAKIGVPCLIGRFRNSLEWYYYDTTDTIIDCIKFDAWEDALDCIFNDSMIDTNNVDFVTFHIYDTPDNFMSVLRTLKTKVGEEKPVWITECGYLWYRWYHGYKDYLFYDNFISDTVWLADKAIVYWPDPFDTNYTPYKQAERYAILLDSLVNFLRENNKSKFFFFSVNIDNIGPYFDYDNIYSCSGYNGGLCTLYVNKLSVRYPLRSDTLSPNLSLLKSDFTPLPAYDTIFSKVNIASDVNGLKGASGPKIAVDEENFYLIHKHSGGRYVRIPKDVVFWNKREQLSTSSYSPSIFKKGNNLYTTKIDISNGRGYFRESGDNGDIWNNWISILGADNVTSPIHITASPWNKILFTYISEDSLKVTKYHIDNCSQNSYSFVEGNSLANPMTFNYLDSEDIWEEYYIYEDNGTIKMKPRGCNPPENISMLGSCHSPYAVERFNNLYVVWVNSTDLKIRFRKYSNGNWSNIQDVTTLNIIDEKVQPTLVVYPSGGVGVVWSDVESRKRNIYISESEGMEWTEKIRISGGVKDCSYPATGFKDSRAFVSYIEGVSKPVIRYQKIKWISP